eukprot:gnl/Spiro4/26518_TR13197_c0_g1_i2.p1 gnl/Spiro4/26518_TR13197_c0_g1~~gnl/Spiro4/26518_TR13197_c0_g1_i2.p1  ORF type:complete len:473 (-),score=143.80 gnl/Spiro4/26518_TR13197_c0_g1_i2:144-1508(-)
MAGANRSDDVILNSGEEDANILQWRIKKLIQGLNRQRGAGTSMISLIIPAGGQIARVTRMLDVEFGTAQNIKSRTNRLSVLSAITSTQQRLKLYPRVPPNGLVIYCGKIMLDDGKDKQVNIDIEPFKPINTSLYMCDKKFHTEALKDLLESDDKFGFIVMDGSGCLFGTLSGNTRETLHKFNVDLPKKHGRGGQSALRFARLRMEKRHNYVKKVAELATHFFITADKINVTGLVLAGHADFKTDLASSDMFDSRLVPKILKTVDISYGGENGFNQAIELSQEVLAGVKFIQEKKLISQYFEQISQDSGRYCFGISDTMRALEMGAVETLIVYENLEHHRFVVRAPSTQSERVLILSGEQARDPNNFIVDGENAEVLDNVPLVDFLALHYKRYGAVLEFVTNRSQEGSQFVRGLGGIGGLLRYQVDFLTMDVNDEAAALAADGDFMDEDQDEYYC